MFNFDVCDDKNSTIKCVAFGDVAERTYLVVQENQVSELYRMREGREVRIACRCWRYLDVE